MANDAYKEHMRSVAKELADKFRIIPREDDPEKWVDVKCEYAGAVMAHKLKWREEVMKNNVNNEGIEDKIKSLMTCYYQDRAREHNLYHEGKIIPAILYTLVGKIASKYYEQIIQTVCQHYRDRLMTAFKKAKYDSFDALFFIKDIELEKIEQIINEVMK